MITRFTGNRSVVTNKDNFSHFQVDNNFLNEAKFHLSFALPRGRTLVITQIQKQTKDEKRTDIQTQSSICDFPAIAR